MKRNLMHFLLSALLCVGSLAAYAQNVKVRGQLVDAETGEPLIGASVVVEGTTQGSVTDIDGYFLTWDIRSRSMPWKAGATTST